jgi:pimeloyl-ACP methyl ester carboxylesterase
LLFYYRFGGLYSSSVNRLVGPYAPIEIRQAQLAINKQNSTLVFKHYLMGMNNWTVAEDYRQVRVPTLIVGGRYDQTTPIHPNIDDLRQWLHLAKVEVGIVEYCGHNFMVEDPVAVNCMIHRFLMVYC